MHKYQNSEHLNVVKRQISKLYIRQNWFHIKSGKSWNFHTVKCLPCELIRTDHDWFWKFDKFVAQQRIEKRPFVLIWRLPEVVCFDFEDALQNGLKIKTKGLFLAFAVLLICQISNINYGLALVILSITKWLKFMKNIFEIQCISLEFSQ